MEDSYALMVNRAVHTDLFPRYPFDDNTPESCMNQAPSFINITPSGGERLMIKTSYGGAPPALRYKQRAYKVPPLPVMEDAATVFGKIKDGIRAMPAQDTFHVLGFFSISTKAGSSDVTDVNITPIPAESFRAILESKCSTQCYMCTSTHKSTRVMNNSIFQYSDR